MKPVFAVVLRPGTALDARAMGAKLIATPLGEAQSLRCTHVGETSYGFLQLVPVPAEQNLGLAIFVPASEVLYMLRAEQESSMGFLPAT